MMRLFRSYVIGGNTGSREGAWFLVVWLAVFPLCLVAVAEFMGRDMPTTAGALVVIVPSVLAIWAGAHGLQKAIDSGIMSPKQVRLEDAPLDK